MRILVAALLALVVVMANAPGRSWAADPVVPSDAAARQAVTQEVTQAMQRTDWAWLDRRYAEALATDRRLPSGISYSARMSGALFSQFITRPADQPAQPGDDALWSGLETLAQQWMASAPDSSFAAIALARAYIRHGMVHRGHGLIPNYSPDGRRLLREYLEKAEAALMSRRAVGEKDPNWWVERLRGAMFGDMERNGFDNIARAAIEAHPGAYDIWFAIADARGPRWGGTPQVLAALAADAVHRTRGAEGESLYARIYWHYFTSLEAGQLSEGRDIDWPRIRAGFDDIVKRYPEARNLNMFARFACEAGDRATLRRVIGRIETPDPALWTSRTNFTRCQNLARE